MRHFAFELRQTAQSRLEFPKNRRNLTYITLAVRLPPPSLYVVCPPRHLGMHDLIRRFRCVGPCLGHSFRPDEQPGSGRGQYIRS